MVLTYNGSGELFGGNVPTTLDKAKNDVREFLKESGESVVSETDNSLTASHGEVFTFKTVS